MSRIGVNDVLLDKAFGDPRTRHGLSFFSASLLAALEMRTENDRIVVRCLKTGRWRVAKPEEVVRQLVLHWLVAALGYHLDRIDIEVPIKMGSTYASKKADIVVFVDARRLRPFIILEVKRPSRQDGLSQLHSYMNATGVYYGTWINGNTAVYQLRRDPNLFETLPRLPKVGETLDDVKQPLRKSELEPITDLKEEIQYLENTVLANAGVSTFEEIFKLIFAKLYDEFDKDEDEAVDFRTTTAPLAEQWRRLNNLFHQATNEWPDIFSSNDHLELTPEALLPVASALQGMRLLGADLDVIDAAFEYLINPEQKGDKGQYFTPRPVVKMCVRMLNPKPKERVLDPACGPAGFLIHALHWIAREYLKPRYTKNLDKKIFDYAAGRLFGIDFDGRLSRVAKAMMLIAGDGRSNIYRVNTLDQREWENRSDALSSVIREGAFDVVMTNPPFAGKISSAEILGGFDLAYKGDPQRFRRSSTMTRDVLFIEWCLRFLRPGGRMAIVVPQGSLNNLRARYIREWVRDQARVLAVIGLHANTFKPFTNTKTSVLFLQRWSHHEKPLKDYPIFMAVNNAPVRASNGSYRFRRDAFGSFLLDQDGNKIVDHDLNEIADAFILFARNEGLGFWS